MSNDSLGWYGKKVRHEDGRTGVIRREYAGFCHVSLTILVDGTENDTEMIQLNSDGPDSGATGWSWLYSAPGEEEAWGVLGDHNQAALNK